MTALKPYPEYEDSGVKWLGDIPLGWALPQLRRVATIINGGTPTPDPDNWGGDVPWATPVDLNAVDGGTIDETARTLTRVGLSSGSASAPTGSIILSTRAPIGYSALAARDIAFNQGCKGIVPNGGLDPKFVLFVMQAARMELTRRGQGTTFLELSASALGALPVPIPSTVEQRSIAVYLDRETAEIDAFIADQEELIGLLTERRAATITHAVTKGLDPSVPMMDSGVEWLGETPRDWTVASLRRVVRRVVQGVSPQAESGLSDSDSAGVLRAGCVNGGVFNDLDHKRLPDGFQLDDEIRVRVGDLIVNRASGSPALVGSAALVRDLRFNLILSDKTFRLDLNPLVIPGFAELYLNSTIYRRQILGAISGAEGLANNLPISALKSFVLAIPPVAEQREIVVEVERETAGIDAAIADAREAIALSRERRAALISAAVTGKIDVRGAA